MVTTSLVDANATAWDARIIAELLGHVNPSQSAYQYIHREAVLRYKSGEVVKNVVTRSITKDAIACLRLGEAVKTDEPVTVEIFDDSVPFSLPGQVVECREVAPGLMLIIIRLP